MQNFSDSPLHLESSKILTQRTPAEKDTLLLKEVNAAVLCSGTLI